MPAPLVPHEVVPKLAEQVDSLAMLRVLQYLQKASFVMNGGDVTPTLAEVLKRLTYLGLVDPGYDGDVQGEPYLWTSNGNGSRVLRYYMASPGLQDVLEGRLEIHPRAQTALSALTEWDQAKVLAAAEALQRKDPATWVKDEALRLEEDKQVYLVRVSPEMRAFVRVLGPGKVELFDLVREETLQLFLERQRTAGAPQ
jgi:hypothetical protein